MLHLKVGHRGLGLLLGLRTAGPGPRLGTFSSKLVSVLRDGCIRSVALNYQVSKKCNRNC